MRLWGCGDTVATDMAIRGRNYTITIGTWALTRVFEVPLFGWARGILNLETHNEPSLIKVQSRRSRRGRPPPRAAGGKSPRPLVSLSLRGTKGEREARPRGKGEGGHSAGASDGL